MHQAFQIAIGFLYRAEKPERNPLYKRWIKRFACIACGGTRNVDPAHSGQHGLGSKSTDYSCIPLCRACHVAFDANPSDFAIIHHLDIPTLTAYFNHLWELKQRRTA